MSFAAWPGTMGESVFINYRRGEDQAAAGRLYDQLEAAFTRERIFIDVDNIPPGRDFTEELANRVAQCDIFLAVVGRNWADVVDVDGGRRLDNPNDWVRVEIESAQRLGKHIIPVLVNGAEMPRPERLPDSLQSFTRRNAARLTHERFRADVQALISAIGKLREAARAEAKTRAAAAREVRPAQPAAPVAVVGRRFTPMAFSALAALAVIAAAAGFVAWRSASAPPTAAESPSARVAASASAPAIASPAATAAAAPAALTPVPTPATPSEATTPAPTPAAAASPETPAAPVPKAKAAEAQSTPPAAPTSVAAFTAASPTPTPTATASAASEATATAPSPTAAASPETPAAPTPTATPSTAAEATTPAPSLAAAASPQAPAAGAAKIKVAEARPTPPAAPSSPAAPVAGPSATPSPQAAAAAPEVEAALAAPPVETIAKPPNADAVAKTPLVVAELRRLGCYRGAATDWGDVDLRVAVFKFSQLVKLAAVPTEPDAGLLAALKSEPDHFCAPQCSPREVVSEGRCVPKTCGGNEILTSAGACVARPAAPKPRATAAARAAPAPAAGKHCFSFNGSSYCE